MRPKPEMDPFAKRMVQSSFIYAGVLFVMFAALTVVYLHIRPRCSERTVEEALSPDRSLAADVMECRCGEEEPFRVHVNLRPASDPLQYGFFSGRADHDMVLDMDQDAQTAGLKVSWTSPSTLTVFCSGCQGSRQIARQERWRNIQITYNLY